MTPETQQIAEDLLPHAAELLTRIAASIRKNRGLLWSTQDADICDEFARRIRSLAQSAPVGEPDAIYEGLGNVSVGMTNLVKGDKLYLRPSTEADRRDAERLDWMCQGQHTMGFSRDGEACWVCFHRDDDEAPKQGPAAYTIREAIDAARTQEKPK